MGNGFKKRDPLPYREFLGGSVISYETVDGYF